MTITELISKLEKIKSEHGDLKLYTNEEEFSIITTEKFDDEEAFPGYRKRWESIIWENDNN